MPRAGQRSSFSRRYRYFSLLLPAPPVHRGFQSALLLILVLTLSIGNAHAFKTNEGGHLGITSAALRSTAQVINGQYFTFSECAIERIREANVAVDGLTSGSFWVSENHFDGESFLAAFSLATKGKVTIRIYDVAGRCVRTLVDAVKDPGVQQARWTGGLDSGGKAASSIYFYRITYPDGTTSAKKMAILR